MPVLNPTTGEPLTVLDIITDALLEIGVIAQGQTPTAPVGQFAFRKLNRLLDTFNAKRLFIYAMSFDTYTLTANHSPHTIGPAATVNPDFIAAVGRPEELKAASVIINNVDIPIAVQDAKWWAAQLVKTQTSTFPTDVYYQKNWPNGLLYFWPIPTVAYQVRLETWIQLSQFSKLTDAISFPPGYLELLISGLAVTLCPAFGKTPDPVLVGNAQRALATVQGANDKAQRISLAGGGLPGGGKTYWDWRTGQLV